MKRIQEKIIEEFGNKLRIRVCGLCIEDGKVLLVNHQSLNKEGDFWSPPGGGMDYAQSAKENLKREFIEETGLEIKVEHFLFVHEYLRPPLHAIELMFLVRRIKGELQTGFDPEMDDDTQIIKNVRFMTEQELKSRNPNTIHQVFRNAGSFDELCALNGYYIWRG
jgi:8-oxo-dGTP diphosphatase